MLRQAKDVQTIFEVGKEYCLVNLHESLANIPTSTIIS